MVATMYYKCRICGCVCNLKYQVGYAQRHPIRYKCLCGISIRGKYDVENGISFENAFEIKAESEVPSLVVCCSGDFFTVPPFVVHTFEETITTVPSPFIYASQILDYESYIREFEHILSYRDRKYCFVRAINELYENNNIEQVEKIIREHFDPKGDLFPLNNAADYLRATSMINQFQFLNYDGTNRTPKTVETILLAYREHTTQFTEFLKFMESTSKLEIWKKQIHATCDQIYDKIDLLMPAVSVDFVRKSESIDLDYFAITTTSFEDIKQLYVDLYELIGNLLILAFGIDNIILKDDYNEVKVVPGLNIKDISGVMKMRNKGNIIKLIDEKGPIESLICKSLNSEVRNSIGHYSYISNEIADSYGQKIEFKDPYNKENTETKSLLLICYDIWQMYKTLGVFNEIIHHFEIELLALKGIYPSFVTNHILYRKMVGRNRIYPNDPCPCGSGLKYKKCCGK